MYVIQDKFLNRSFFLNFSDDGKQIISISSKSGAREFHEYEEAKDFISSNLHHPEDYTVVKV